MIREINAKLCLFYAPLRFIIGLRQFVNPYRGIQTQYARYGAVNWTNQIYKHIQLLKYYFINDLKQN